MGLILSNDDVLRGRYHLQSRRYRRFVIGVHYLWQQIFYVPGVIAIFGLPMNATFKLFASMLYWLFLSAISAGSRVFQLRALLLIDVEDMQVVVSNTPLDALLAPKRFEFESMSRSRLVEKLLFGAVFLEVEELSNGNVRYSRTFVKGLSVPFIGPGRSLKGLPNSLTDLEPLKNLELTRFDLVVVSPEKYRTALTACAFFKPS